MATATEHQTHAVAPAGDAPAPHDMEKDIDAKSATWWVLGGTVVLFVSLWLMLPIFIRILEEEQLQKVNFTPNNELSEVIDAQNEFLNGANPQRKTLEQAMQEALK